MDIQKIIADLTEKLGGKADLIKDFLADPIKSIKELLNIDIDADKISEIVDGVKATLGDGIADVAEGAKEEAEKATNEGKSFIQKILSIFKKK